MGRNFNRGFRGLATSALVVAIASACSVGTDGGSQDGDRTLKLAHIFPDSSAVNTAAVAMADGAPDVTDGRVNFEVYPGAQLGGDEELGAGLASGDVDCAFFAATASGLDDRLQLSLLPFIATTYDSVDQVFFDKGGVLQTNERDVLAGLGITAFGFYENDFRGLTNNTRVVTSPDDLEGLALRVPGLPMYVDLFKAWGAKPVAIPFPELYTALQQGTVDGQDNGVVLTANSKFDEVQKYLTLTRHAYGMGTLACNTKVWESLSKDDRAALTKLADTVTTDQTQEVRDSVDSKLAGLEKNGLKVTKLSDAQIAEFAKIKDQIWTGQEDTFGKDVIDKLRQESDAATQASAGE